MENKRPKVRVQEDDEEDGEHQQRINEWSGALMKYSEELKRENDLKQQKRIEIKKREEIENKRQLNTLLWSVLKFVVAMTLLFFIGGKFSYSSYVALHWFVFIVCVLFAGNSNKKNQDSLTIFFALIALLFNPFMKVPLSKTIWSGVDAIVAIVIIVSIFIPLGTQNKK